MVFFRIYVGCQVIFVEDIIFQMVEDCKNCWKEDTLKSNDKLAVVRLYHIQYVYAINVG